MAAGFFVVHPGLEPRLADPESDVLPLHQWTIIILLPKKHLLFLSKAGAKVLLFSELANFFFFLTQYSLIIR